jgi:nucleoside-diphosphate-sugar epimerase
MQLGTNQILVTGAAGWLGQNLVRALVHGLPDCPALSEPNPGLAVRCLVLPGQDVSFLRATSDKLEVVEGDIRSAEDCRRFCEGAAGAVVLHTAGIIHPRKVADFQQVNVQGTDNVLRAAEAEHVKRIVVVSSNSPCGCNPHPDHLFDEESSYAPYMNYGRSKMEMELLVRRHQEAGKLETVIIRAPWFYGPLQPARQTLFFKMIRDGKMPIVGSGENRRSMAYVDNLCQGILLAADSERAIGQSYWIADERPYAMNEIIDAVECLLANEFGETCVGRQRWLPSFTSDVAQAVDASLQKLGVYHQKIHVLSEMNKTIACSVAKAKRELRYAPTIALEEGMRRSISWCVDRGLLP